MQLRSIEGVNFENTHVLVTVCFNVELTNDGKVTERFRFEIVKKTIDFILAFPGAKVALLTHFGRPKGRDMSLSVSQILSEVETALGHKIVFVPDCIGDGVEKGLEKLLPGEILLLENVRFHPEEEGNDPHFAQELARPFTIFVNEAFAVCHRTHASIVGLPKVLPAYAGFRVIEEIEKLDQVLQSPKHPAIALIGGAKIETKLPLIRVFEEKYDRVLVGGRVANEAIDEQISFSEKVVLPMDFESSNRLDIGPVTVARYIHIIKEAKTIVWNGPMGMFEEKPYDIGTKAVLQAILESQALSVVGGGESLALLEEENVMDKISFVSSGGGAMLEYLSGNILPGLTPLQIKKT